MYYETKIEYGWVWERTTPDAPWCRMSAEGAVAHLLALLERASQHLAELSA